MTPNPLHRHAPNIDVLSKPLLNLSLLLQRGPKKHLKRLCAPRSWMLAKSGGVFAPRPTPGPHKLRESIPIVILLRNR